MKRRAFIVTIAAAAAALASGAWRLAQAASPARIVRALRPRAYAGKVCALDGNDVRHPGRWTG